MRFGKDFWFWVRLLVEILKALLGFSPDNPGTKTAKAAAVLDRVALPNAGSVPGKLSPGHRMFNAACAYLVQENGDDDKTMADFTALERV